MSATIIYNLLKPLIQQAVNNFSQNYIVYWIHYPHHKDIFKDGYVGITKNLENRTVFGKFSRHNEMVQEAIKNGAVLEIIHWDLTCTEASDVERIYRPESNIGWNKLIGGSGDFYKLVKLRTVDSLVWNVYGKQFVDLDDEEIKEYYKIKKTFSHRDVPFITENFENYRNGILVFDNELKDTNVFKYYGMLRDELSKEKRNHHRRTIAYMRKNGIENTFENYKYWTEHDNLKIKHIFSIYVLYYGKPRRKLNKEQAREASNTLRHMKKNSIEITLENFKKHLR